MEKSKVYFTDTRQHHHYNIYNKIRNLLNSIKIKQIIKKDDIVAIKLHFGEYGNTGFIPPNYVRIVVDLIKEIGGKPFLTDGSTLYKGSRSDAISHLETAIRNGFAYSVVNAPIMIADGVKGNSFVKVKINGKHFSEVEVASEAYNADVLIILTHFKLHELCAFGGSLKNIGMGLASKHGKLLMHSSVNPNVNGSKCVKCLKCKEICPVNAIQPKQNSVSINPEICVGCGQCIMTCPVNAINVVWNSAANLTQEKTIEYAAGILSNKKNKYCCLNFLLKITPECDCYSHSDTPIVSDIGITASNDIVAIDKASLDLLNAQVGLTNTALKTNLKSGEDKIKGVYPELDGNIQIDHAVKLKLGSPDYELIKIK